MGWAYCGTDKDGREIGYGVEATCDHLGCNEEIDRGLGYVCGGMHGGGEHGCGGYFCGYHLLMMWDADVPQVCPACVERIRRAALDPTQLLTFTLGLALVADTDADYGRLCWRLQRGEVLWPGDADRLYAHEWIASRVREIDSEALARQSLTMEGDEDA